MVWELFLFACFEVEIGRLVHRKLGGWQLYYEDVVKELL